jgi:hypothetical protein
MKAVIEGLLKDLSKKGFVPYIMGWHDNLSMIPENIGSIRLNKIDVSKQSSKQFFSLYHAANGLAFGGKNMAMPKWVALDVVALPTVSIGFAIHSEMLTTEMKNKFELDNYSGIVPISMFTALPALHNHNTMINFSLCSVMEKQGLATASMALAIYLYNPDYVKSIIQYDNPSVMVHSKFGNLNIESAKVSMHDLADMTLVYRIDVRDKEKVFTNFLKEVSIGEAKEGASFLLDPLDNERKSIMQHNIENSIADYSILRPGIVHVNGKMLSPIKEIIN